MLFSSLQESTVVDTSRLMVWLWTATPTCRGSTTSCRAASKVKEWRRWALSCRETSAWRKPSPGCWTPSETSSPASWWTDKHLNLKRTAEDRQRRNGPEATLKQPWICALKWPKCSISAFIPWDIFQFWKTSRSILPLVDLLWINMIQFVFYTTWMTGRRTSCKENHVTCPHRVK